MPTIFIKDDLRQAVEAATGGKVTVLYSADGLPGYYHVVPKFNVQDIDASLGTGTHPAFIVNGVEKSEIFIGQFLAIVKDGKALSLPGQVPAAFNFDQALTYCANLGPGFHLMTNAEWAALALWCDKNGFMPRGNSNWGASIDASYESGRRVDNGTIGATTGDGKTLTGSGPVSWRHNNDVTGISDLTGNIWELVGGMRLNDGEIQIIANNDAADSTKDQSAGSALWKAIKSDGSLVAPGTAGTLKYDSVSAGTAGLVGAAQLDDVIDNRTGTAGQTAASDGYTHNTFESLAADAGITVPLLLKQLALFPHKTPLGGDGLYVRNYGERLPTRGGSWSRGSYCGVFALFLNDPRSTIAGFRPAFVA